jgi:hypothetical protein
MALGVTVKRGWGFIKKEEYSIRAFLFWETG